MIAELFETVAPRLPTRRSGAAAGRSLGRAVVLLAVFCVWLAASGVEPPELDGDPFRGRVLFEDKHCVQCHSVWGHGGTLGPEIARAVAGKSVPQLAGEFWNHTPRMIDETTARGYPWPSLDRGEMADLLSYLYYLRLFDRPGDPTAGAVAFARLGCGSCHGLGPRRGFSAGPLDGFSSFTSPVPLAQAMWNSGPAMQRAQRGRGRPIPQFAGDEMADIQAHIHEQGTRPSESVELLPLPDPRLGGELFRRKRCSSCHGGGERGGEIELGVAALQKSVAEIAGILWNHSTAMHELMRSRGIPFPELRGNEMADLIAYLHSVGYAGHPGDPVVGAIVFQQKGCAGCHAGEQATGGDLATSGVHDPVTLSAAMWNHAPEMHEVMAERGVAWPKFEQGEMENLAAFLSDMARRASGADR